MATREIKQARLGFQSCFRFEDEFLEYSTRDSGGELSFKVAYAAIDLENFRHVDLPSSKPASYALSAGLALGFIALRTEYGSPRFGMIVGALGFGLIMLGILAKDFRWFRIRFELLDAVGAGQPIRLLCDRNRDVILEQLKTHRALTLRKYFENLYELTDANARRRRLAWLLEAGAISQDEHDTAALADDNSHRLLANNSVN